MCFFEVTRHVSFFLSFCSKILELEEELKVVGNNMKSLELSEQEVRSYDWLIKNFRKVTATHDAVCDSCLDINWIITSENEFLYLNFCKFGFRNFCSFWRRIKRMHINYDCHNFFRMFLTLCQVKQCYALSHNALISRRRLGCVEYTPHFLTVLNHEAQSW